MSVISVQKVPSYDLPLLSEAVKRHFEILDVEKDLRPNMRILIKPNLVSARKPDTAVTTNPILLTAIIKWLRDRGITNIIIADSPGGPYTSAALRTVYSVCGIKPLEKIAKLNYDTSWQVVSCEEKFANHSFNIISPICDADYIINVAKLKTHAITTISAGIKNMFGAIPGLQKPELHYRHVDIQSFSNMLVDLALTTKPNITVIDAVDAMEGNGPNSGTVKHTGTIFASRDVFAQDWYASLFMGIPPETVPMLHIARDRGYIIPEEIVVRGNAGKMQQEPFILPESLDPRFLQYVPKAFRAPFQTIVTKLLMPFPKFDQQKCIGCGKCAESCPPHIITIQDGKASAPHKGCINCLCCQEMCPVHAIGARRLLRR